MLARMSTWDSQELGDRDFVGKLLRLTERKAEAAGVSREDYLDGIVSGKYPPITSREVEQFEANDE